MYLDIPGIAGEVTDAKFEGQIEVLSYSGTTTGGPGELSLTKYIDSSSPALFLLVATGTSLQAATLTVVQTVNGAVASSMTIDMQTVLITSVVIGGDTEAITLSFQGSKVTTKHGGIDPAPVTKMYLDIPGIAGEVTDAKFEGQIEVLSYSGTTTGGPGELSLTKYIDSSSPALFLLVATGTSLQAATLTVVQTVNGAVASSMTIDMQTVLITSVVIGGDTEALTLSFQGSKVTTKHGGIDPAPVTKMYLDIPGIAGEVTDAKFEGQIEVLSYSGTTTGGPGELSLTKYIDSSSPRIFAIVASGTPLKAARLSVVTTVNGKIDSSMTIDLRDVFITSVVAGGETESITLSFLRSKVTQ